MKSVRYLPALLRRNNLIRVLVFTAVQLCFIDLSAQTGLKRPDKISEVAWARFENMIKYDDPDSIFIYDANNDEAPYEKKYFRYDSLHRLIYTDIYRMHDDGFRFLERHLERYDSLTGKLKEHEVQVMHKKFRDSFTTRMEKLVRYDNNGNVLTSIEYGMNKEDYYKTVGDSNVYGYNAAAVPVSLSKYSFDETVGKWILKKQFKADSFNSKGEPNEITMASSDNAMKPVYRYHSIKWAKPCKTIDNIDTQANEYTTAYFQSGKWIDSLKKQSFMNKDGRVDSSVTYLMEKDSLAPYKKDVYAYDAFASGYGSVLNYIYYENHWLLRSGKRRVINIDNELYIKTISQKYIFDAAGNTGKWTDELKIIGY